ncbi:hypothetical protein REPUB_Repub11eG0058400 [Reevesia pubescens]
MASFNVYIVFVVLVIGASGAAMARDVDPTKVNNCETKMTLHCVIGVYNSIFKTGIVTKKCCDELLVVGQICHNAFVKKTLQNPMFKNNNPSVILSRSEQVWKKCFGAKDVSPAASP